MHMFICVFFLFSDLDHDDQHEFFLQKITSIVVCVRDLDHDGNVLFLNIVIHVHNHMHISD